MTVMPMFPLGSLLFPSMPLTLRIFEERYLKLLGDLMSSDTPEFGVVLVSRGSEVGGGEQRMTIGTVASVTEIGTTDEFLGLESVGSRRFSVNDWLPDDPYPIADIEFIPDLIWEDSLMPARVHLELAVRNLLTFASQFGDFQFGADVELSDDPMEACWQLAGVLPIGEMDRFDLLGSQSAEELIAQTYEIVTTADETLRAMLASDDEPDVPLEFS
ncbi:MAG: LON peptidase substrate-binding domain-containing protein [Microbacteriaceae bacterium]|nr:LON peptidase substrate-binding domain-containing protein [Microbacteriaceae bacterium]